jgi:hypothetical protein
MSDMDVVEQKLVGLEKTVNGLRNDVKEISDSLRELIRIDGDMKRIGDAVGRIGKETADHESRLRVLELKGGKLLERLMTHGLSVAIGGAVMFFIGKM